MPKARKVKYLCPPARYGFPPPSQAPPFPIPVPVPIPVSPTPTPPPPQSPAPAPHPFPAPTPNPAPSPAPRPTPHPNPSPHPHPQPLTHSTPPAALEVAPPCVFILTCFTVIIILKCFCYGASKAPPRPRRVSSFV